MGWSAVLLLALAVVLFVAVYLVGRNMSASSGETAVRLYLAAALILGAAAALGITWLAA